jgi:CubicO group peptidase (beta-lactamase class C family)
LGARRWLPTGKPEDVGLSSERLGKITEMLRANTAKGEIPGAVLLIARHGKIAYFENIGFLDPQAKSPMPKDAIFRIYSMSKPITTVAAMILFEEGKITLDEPIGKYIPALAKPQVATNNAVGTMSELVLVPANRPISVQDLMRHTSGLTYGFFGDTPVKKVYVAAKLWDDYPDNAEFVERLGKLPLAYQPGTTWDYSHSTDVLGRLVEVASGKSLYAFEKERILDPLAMADTGFYVTDERKQGRVAEPFSEDRSFGVDADFNDPRVVRKWESGGGGMVSTALDYARFLQMLLNGGRLDGVRLLSRKTLEYMTADHLGPVTGAPDLLIPGYGFGLGFAVRLQAGIAQVPGSIGQYFWGGLAGTTFWVDPKEDFFALMLIQAPGQREYYRVLFRDMVYAAFDD